MTASRPMEITSPMDSDLPPASPALSAVAVFPPDVRSIPMARRHVASHLEGVEPALVEVALLLTSELAANAVQHAGTEFSVEVRLDDHALRVEVRDAGVGTPLPRSPAATDPSGRGLQIVESLARAWGVDQSIGGGKGVWFVLGRSGAAPDPQTLLMFQRDRYAQQRRRRLEDLLPSWLFAVRGAPALLLAVALPLILGLPLSVTHEPEELRLAPLLGLVLIVVAATCGWVATAAASVVVVIEHWLLGVPPSGSFRLERPASVVAVAAMTLLAAGVTAVTRRIERTVEAVRALDDDLTEQARVESGLRRQAEHTGAQIQAALRLATILAAHHGVRDVAAAALSSLALPAPLASGSVVLVSEGHSRVLATLGASDPAAIESIDLGASEWLAPVVAGEPAFVDDRADFARRYPDAHVLRMFDSRAWVVVPFRAGDATGLLSVHFEAPQPVSSLALYFSLVGELLATAVERAMVEERQQHQHVELERSFAERDRIARTLSTSLLPPTLPRLPGFAAAGWLQPAHGDEVAGDFYDLFALSDGGWAAVLGDVCGKGAEAAAVTSLTRYAARTTALDNPHPPHVAWVVNQTLAADTSDLFCTMAIVRYVPEAASVEVALAGHPKVRKVGQEVQALGHFGTVLGLASTPPNPERAPFDPGELILLFSDGLIDRDPDFGEAELDGFLRARAGSTAQGLADELRDLVADLRPVHPDDVAILVVERT